MTAFMTSRSMSVFPGYAALDLYIVMIFTDTDCEYIMAHYCRLI